MGNLILELAGPFHPRLPSHRPPDPSDRQPWLPHPSLTPTEPRGPALGMGGLTGPQTITAAATPAPALGLPAFFLHSAVRHRHCHFYFRPRAEAKGH